MRKPPHAIVLLCVLECVTLTSQPTLPTPFFGAEQYFPLVCSISFRATNSQSDDCFLAYFLRSGSLGKGSRWKKIAGGIHRHCTLAESKKYKFYTVFQRLVFPKYKLSGD